MTPELLQMVLGRIRNGIISPDILIRPSLTNSSRIGFSYEYRIDAFARNRLRSILPPLSDRIQGHDHEGTVNKPPTLPQKYAYFQKCHNADALPFPLLSFEVRLTEILTELIADVSLQERNLLVLYANCFLVML